MAPYGNTNPLPNPFATNAGVEYNGQGIQNIIGPNLQRQDGSLIDTSLIVVDLIGIYFSAHWCPPCQRFTPILKECYTSARAVNMSFEVIFVSSDRNVESFNEYFRTMGDWLAIPYYSSFRQTLGAHFAVTGIPCFILLNGISGKVISQEGVQMVYSNSLSRMFRINLDNDVENISSIDQIIDSLDNNTSLSASDRLDSFKVLITALGNIIKAPTDPKYRVLKKSNAIVQKKLNHRQLQQILKYCGFRETPTAFTCYRENMKHMKEAHDFLCILASSCEMS